MLLQDSGDCLCAFSLSATGTLNTPDVWFPVSLKVPTSPCLSRNRAVYETRDFLSPGPAPFLCSHTQLPACCNSFGEVSVRLASPGWSCKNSLVFVLPWILFINSRDPLLRASKNIVGEPKPRSHCCCAPGPCSWCPFHFLSGNAFPLVFTETVRLDGMRFCY